MRNFLRKTLSKLFGKGKKVQPGQIQEKRKSQVIYLFYAFFFILSFRAIMIQVFPSSKDSLQDIADRQYQKEVNLSPYRGVIYDRKGVPLAISVKKPSISVNPRVFDPTKREVRKLAKILEVSSAHITKVSEKRNYFSWLKRKVSHRAAEKIRELNISGINILTEQARFYPSGKAAANLIGYVGIDNTGLLGLEHKYDSYLKRKSEKVVSTRDAKGNLFFLNSNKASPEKAGNNIHLTIDSTIQEIAQEALDIGVEDADAKGGFVIVSDPHTGRILAMANSPTFDPNDRHIKMKRTSNQAISNVFEPGSTMKPFVVAAALEQKLTTIDEVHNCEKNGVYRVGPGQRISDEHPHETLTTEEVLVKSSNICTFKIAERLGPQSLYEVYKGFGFADKNRMLGLMGENAGGIDDWKRWRPIRFANIAFGQGHTVSGLEMVRAYGAIANGGSLISPYVVEKITSESGKMIKANQSDHIGQIISPETSLAIRKALEKVTQSTGTARLAATKDFSAGGKTGTAEKVDSETRAYSATKRTASFAGFAPVLDPHIVVYVVIDEPGKTPYYGGKWAGPVFSEITQKTLKYLNVASDKVPLEISSHGTKNSENKRL